MNPAASGAAALMHRAVRRSLEHVEAGGLPFVGVVVGESYVSDYGVNQVQQTGDPSAHAEIVAMRRAMADLDRGDLHGMSLLATGEPCGMCYRFALDHGISRIYVAVDAETVAGFGFDYRRSYPALGVDRPKLTGLVTALPVEGGLEPFNRYLQTHRIGAPRA